jgi:hypothetical protein
VRDDDYCPDEFTSRRICFIGNVPQEAKKVPPKKKVDLN